MHACLGRCGRPFLTLHAALPPQVLSCSADEVLSQRAYMLFYSRVQPRPSLPDLAAAQAAAAPAAPAVALTSMQSGHVEDDAPALTTADRSRVAASPWQSMHPSGQLPKSTPSGRNGKAGSHASSSKEAAEGSTALHAGMAGLRLEEGSAVRAAGDGTDGGLESELADVFEGRGLCRGEHPAGPALSVPVKSF